MKPTWILKMTLGSFLFGLFLNVYSQNLTPKQTTICWDSSHSMEQRDLEKEFSYLERYFTTYPELEVTILFFSNTIDKKESYSVSSGHWGLVKNSLSNVTYDGGTSYSGLADYTDSDHILLFTDGHQNTRSESPYFQGELFVINSMPTYNQANLNLLTILNKGNLVNLAEASTIANTAGKKYFGIIQGSQISNRQVEIAVKGREQEVIRPEADGTYQINATEGDVMVVTTAGGNRIEKKLGRNSNIDIWIGGTDGIKLEEVVVTGIKEDVVKEKITAAGPKNEEAVGYAVQSISEEDISDISVTVNNATQGKFSGVSLGQNDDLSQVKMRPSNSILGSNYGLIVVDGVPLPRSDSGSVGLADVAAGPSNDTSRSGAIQSTGFLNPQNIANITVLKGLAATNRFGSMGSNGVILITTKTGSFGKAGEKRDLALLTDNIYEGKLKVSAKSLVTPYLRALKKAKNLEEAYEIYLQQREQHANSPAFYIDVFDYFYASSKPLALRVLSNIIESESSAYPTLRAMLFKCQQNGLNALELETASALIERYPEKIQSYFDLAMALKANGEIQKSLDQLIKISDETANPVLDFSGLKKSADAEIKNLVYRYGRQLDLTKIDAKFRKNLTYDARVVLEWNHSTGEFDLQFVNPQKRFFTWEHNSLVNPERLQSEIDQGYGREDFEIVGDEARGEWLINVKYLGNVNEADQTPTFLKCLVQYNFGRPGQREEVYIIRLHEIESETQFVRLGL